MVAQWNIYRGAGSAAAIDYSTPIATVAATGPAGSVRIPPVPGGWPAGVTWFIAVRAVDASGVQVADPAAIIRAEFDQNGQLLPPRPAAVSELAVAPAAGSRLRIRWRYLADADLPPPEQFEIFLAAGNTPIEQMLAGSPAGCVPAGQPGIAQSYTWLSNPLASGCCRAAVRAVAAGATGVAGPACDADEWVRPSQAASIQLLTVEVR